MAPIAVTVRNTPRVASKPIGTTRRLSSLRSTASEASKTRPGMNARRMRSGPTAGSRTPGIKPIVMPPAAKSTGYGTVAVVRDRRRSNVATPPSTIKKKRKLCAVVMSAFSNAGHPEPRKDEVEGDDGYARGAAQPAARQGRQDGEQREVQKPAEIRQRSSREPSPNEQGRHHKAAEQINRVAVHRRRHECGAAIRAREMERQPEVGQAGQRRQHHCAEYSARQVKERL